MAKIDNIENDIIIKEIGNNKNWADVCKNLNISDNQYNRKRLKDFVKEKNIDISHFVSKFNKTDYELNPKLCENCGNPIPWSNRNGKYCSSSCAASITNVGNHKNKKSKDKFCKNCGKELDSRHKIYCSQECQYNFEQNNYIERWKQGLENGLSGKYGVSDRIRKYLMDKNDCKCEKCGWGEIHPITGNVPLQIHHIDGDATNNNEENLQLLCPNCHCLTENYGALNKHATRVDNRKRW